MDFPLKNVPFLQLISSLQRKINLYTQVLSKGLQREAVIKEVDVELTRLGLSWQLPGGGRGVIKEKIKVETKVFLKFAQN